MCRILVIGVLAALVGLLPAPQKGRAAAARLQCSNSLKQVGLALHMHHDTHGALPPGLTPNPDESYPRMTWLMRCLPFVEQEPLWRATVAAYDYRRSPFANPPHLGGTTPIRLFGCPADPRTFTAQPTHGGGSSP